MANYQNAHYAPVPHPQQQGTTNTNASWWRDQLRFGLAIVVAVGIAVALLARPGTDEATGLRFMSRIQSPILTRGSKRTSSKRIVRIGPYKDIIASGVKAGNLLTLSGHVGIDSKGGTVGLNDTCPLCAQFRQAYVNIREVLDEFNTSQDSVTDETWFVVDVQDAMANLSEIMAIREDVLGVPLTDISCTLVQVAALVDPAFLVEIKATAWVA